MNRKKNIYLFIFDSVLEWKLKIDPCYCHVILLNAQRRPIYILQRGDGNNRCTGTVCSCVQYTRSAVCRQQQQQQQHRRKATRKFE